MILGRVTGNVVGTVKHPAFDKRALMIVEPIDALEEVIGDKFVAIDHAQAGPGDRVLILMEGGGIRQILGDPTSPIRALIVGVVDEIEEG